MAERLLPEMRHLDREELLVCLLNTRNVVLGRSTVYVGNLAGSRCALVEVYREARRQAASVIVANHPSGDPSPSGDDLRDRPTWPMRGASPTSSSSTIWSSVMTDG